MNKFSYSFIVKPVRNGVTVPEVHTPQQVAREHAKGAAPLDFPPIDMLN